MLLPASAHWAGQERYGGQPSGRRVGSAEFGCHLAASTGDGLGTALLAAWLGVSAAVARSQSSRAGHRVDSWDGSCWIGFFGLGRPCGANGLLVVWGFFFYSRH